MNFTNDYPMKKAFYLPFGLALMLLIIPANVLSQEKKIEKLAWLTGSWKSQSVIVILNISHKNIRVNFEEQSKKRFNN